MHVAFDVDPVALYTWCLCDDEIEAAQRVFRRRMSDVFVSCYPFLILCGTMRNYIALTLMFIAAQWIYSVCLSANAPRDFVV